MALIVQKFGGTSVATIPRIKEVGKIIKSSIKQNNQVIVVVSAMAGVTNQLVTLCNELSRLNSDSLLAEYDSALASGEIVTAALLALCLQEEGIPARSVLAWQLPIFTDFFYSKALVEAINYDIILECLKKEVIPIIAGFQGLTPDNRISTLGRGGSDTTAALIAGIVKADRCDIYTDVEGVFTADPRIVHQAKRLDYLSFEEMLEFSASGAKVLHPRCVEAALRYNVPIRVLSSFSTTEGTLIKERNIAMEKRIITGITSNKSLLKISITEPQPSFSKICSFIANNKIHIDAILGNSFGGSYSFIAPLTEKNRFESLLVNLKLEAKIADFIIDTKIATVSIIGHGIKNDSTLVGIILEKLEQEKIEISMLQVSEIKISLLINDEDTEKTIRIMHELLIDK